MNEPTGSYRLSSARRSGPGDNPTLVLAVVGVLLVIVLVVLFSVGDREVEPTPSPTPTLAPAATAMPTPSPTMTPSPALHQSEWVEAEIVLPPTATPTMPPLEAYPTRVPRPTPSISQCASYRYSTLQVFAPSAQVKVDIRVMNRCPYDLTPQNLLFEITGWRDGGRVQTVRGVPFETIRRGNSGELSIGLPGSLDWYDEIEVAVFD